MAGGHRFDLALARLERSLGLPTGLFESYRQRYWRKPAGLISLYPGVGPLLNRLYESGKKLGVVTTKGRQLTMAGRAGGVWAEMEELQVREFFPVVIGLEDVTNAKPHPEGLLLALERLGAEPSKAVYIGDAPADIAAAAAAGVQSCWAVWGNHFGSEIGLKPNFIARSPEDVLDLLELPSETTFRLHDPQGAVASTPLIAEDAADADEHED